eukprot:CAMPEP_0168326514 /NCGR_PEP_ID=MMETSP0213-20121227/5340_1 /TAXON_ID=151035 /ORGANISM="Euplotes harpa, Strain FSP1.4" /LENGTH=36 /DNA_ID= /DNA_START= /DNA_END= /DNA_ORIENTATION=
MATICILSTIVGKQQAVFAEEEREGQGELGLFGRGA